MPARTRATTIAVDGVELSVQTFGAPTDATVMLIAGGAQSMIWWEDEFCVRLSRAGRHVIRYDHRDTGQSTTSPLGRPDYSSQELVDDPIRILDAMGVHSAHLVGLSMGGGIAQHLALGHPGRVRSLCLMATSPAVPSASQRQLPPPAPRVMATFTDPQPEPDWTDRDAVVAFRVEAERPFAGDLGFDEVRTRRLAALEVNRTRDMRASMSHHSLLTGGPSIVEAGLDQIIAPTLVIHGTTDPMFPLEHGQALAADIPGARLMPLIGVGHQQPPPPLWEPVLSAMLGNTARY